MYFMGFILSGLFFGIIKKHRVCKGMFGVYYLHFDWIHHVTGFIWTKIAVLYLKKKLNGMSSELRGYTFSFDTSLTNNLKETLSWRTLYKSS